MPPLPFFRKRISTAPESTAETSEPRQPFRIKIGKRFVLISLAALAGLGLACGVAYAFLSGIVSVAALPGWAFPAFWCAVLAAAVSPKIFQGILHRPVQEENGELATTSSASQWKIDKNFGIKAALSVAVLLLFGLLANLYFAGKLTMPGFAWWSGAAFWTLAIAAVTAPRIYLSLPSVAKNPERLSSGGTSTTWILLVGGLFLMNAVLIRSDAAQDAFFVDLTRLFDTRFFTALHWFYFLLGAGGYFVAYILNTRIIVAEQEERPVPHLVFASKLAAILGSTFAVLFVATKFSLFQPLIQIPFSNDLQLRYWSIIWVALILEIALLLYPNFRQEARNAIRTNITEPLKSFSWGVVPLTLLGVAVVGGVTFLFVSGTVRVDELPWWVGPIFWSLVIATALAPKISAALPKRPKKLRSGDRALPKPGLKTLLLAVVAMIPVGLVVGIGYAFYSGTVKFADLPSWTMPAFWSSIIVLGITYRVVESVRAYLKEAGPRRRSFLSVKSKEAAKPAPSFNSSAKQRGFRRSESAFSLFETISNLGPLAWAVPVGIVAVLFMGWLGYSLLTMQRLDADGHPIPMPGWVIPAVSGLVILALVIFKVVTALRENTEGGLRQSSRPVQKTKPVKPTGFNANTKQKTARTGSGFTWPSLPDFSALADFGPMLGLVLIGIVGVTVLGFIAYFFSTMQWLDEDGHPVSMPFWIWPLLCLLAVPKEEYKKHRTRHEYCLEMLDEQGEPLPHRWITGDDELGKSSSFRRALRRRNEKYILAVPSNTTVRDLEHVPEYSGRGAPPKGPFRQVADWKDFVTNDEWREIDVRDGEKRPLVRKLVTCRVLARTERGREEREEERLIVTVRPDGDRVKYDYDFSNDFEASDEELARVILGSHRVEDCFRRAKGTCGLADYEVQVARLASPYDVVAGGVLVFDEGDIAWSKKGSPSLTVPLSQRLDRGAIATPCDKTSTGLDAVRRPTAFLAKRTGVFLPLLFTKRPPTKTIQKTVIS